MIKQAATFCDLDETLYRGVMLRDAARWMSRHGVLPRGYYLTVGWQLLLRNLGLLDHQKAFEQGVRFLASRKLVEVQQMMQAIYDEELKDGFVPGVRQLVASWKKSGPVVIATESLALLATPVAADFGFDAVIGTELEVHDGALTGRPASHVLKGDAKLRAVQAWVQQHNIDLATSTAVGGRRDDAALLKIVGHGIMIDPDAAASALAAVHGWDVIRTI